MGIQCTEYLRLSPGELERCAFASYTREASHQHRLQRLYEVRRQASLDARQQRRSSQQQRRMEEKALKTVEVRAELAAKRVQLEGLLKLKEVCDSDGNAMQTAQQRKVEDEARRCAAEALEVERQKQEALRCLEACRQRKALESLRAEEAQQRQRQRQEVKATERLRARRAAEQGRVTKEAEALVERRHLVEPQVEEKKILKTDVSGLQQLSKTRVKVVREGPPVEAALEQPRVPAPQPSRAQRQAARSRGLAAQSKLQAQRQEEDALREKEELQKKERQTKAMALVEEWAPPKSGSKAWTSELLPWQLHATSEAAGHALGEILESDAPRGSLCWERPRAPVPHPRPRSAKPSSKGSKGSKGSLAVPRARSVDSARRGSTRCVATWLGPLASPPRAKATAPCQPPITCDDLKESLFDCSHLHNEAEKPAVIPLKEPPPATDDTNSDAAMVQVPRRWSSRQRESDKENTTDTQHVACEEQESDDIRSFFEPSLQLTRSEAEKPRRQAVGAVAPKAADVPFIQFPAPRPTRRKIGEEDLALQLDDICRELDAVGLCAWEAFEDFSG
ncbi:unnamed protein product [Durusdinium trenchii]|uniref:Uncharacterized protein n=1 Tax=Durusdinium trenchii TaxID=1381693 RepID=A0ABP0SFW6_9DINO